MDIKQGSLTQNEVLEFPVLSNSLDVQADIDRKRAREMLQNVKESLKLA